MAGAGKSAFCRALVPVCVAAGLTMCAASAGPEAWDRAWTQLREPDFTQAAEEYPACVHVLDVGKADAIILECEGKFALIDAGTLDRGEQVSQYLARRGADRLEFAINSHPDSDHVGGMGEVLTRFETGSYITPELPPKLEPRDGEYTKLKDLLLEKEIPVIHPEPGTEFELNSMRIRVLGPLSPGETTNDNSLVLRVEYGASVFLLMGDAEEAEEEELLESGQNLRADVLKVAHHGSKSSTSKAFLKAVRPEYAVISVKKDRNKLPKKKVLYRLKEQGAQVLRTDVDGTVLFLTDGKDITVETENRKGN
ncbi:MAG TPA: MBL fold metallo-hydrolase [Candidatus Gallacutalibacter pullicola]|uniref:MBL fold metallo-hydrolase n=1 Tax=Candidatus Gallacutalibacter pullicola TaxID=2840830 RepID=A0A9D1DRU2_9FIRM|nr:MBL fold metallo-hydrolase [Candidatus Gallacutalibacter pullicola]